MALVDLTEAAHDASAGLPLGADGAGRDTTAGVRGTTAGDAVDRAEVQMLLLDHESSSGSWLLAERRMWDLMASFCSTSHRDALLDRYSRSMVYLTVLCISSRMFWSSVATNCSILLSTSDWNQVLVSWLPSKTDLHKSAVSLIKA